MLVAWTQSLILHFVCVIADYFIQCGESNKQMDKDSTLAWFNSISFLTQVRKRKNFESKIKIRKNNKR